MGATDKEVADKDHLTDAEIAKRRDEVIRRMARTPPAPKQDKAPPRAFKTKAPKASS